MKILTNIVGSEPTPERLDKLLQQRRSSFQFSFSCVQSVPSNLFFFTFVQEISIIYNKNKQYFTLYLPNKNHILYTNVSKHLLSEVSKLQRDSCSDYVLLQQQDPLNWLKNSSIRIISWECRGKQKELVQHLSVCVCDFRESLHVSERMKERDELCCVILSH